MSEIFKNKRKPSDLMPGSAESVLVYFCSAALIVTTFIPNSIFPFMTLVSWVCYITILLIFIVYRIYKPRNQLKINAKAADFAKNKDFILYLRPFVSSGRLKILCRLPNLEDRLIVGKSWDFELALSLALDPIWPTIAVGHTKKGFGAAKIITSDLDWKEKVIQLASDAQAIVIVPLSRPSTLWEIHQIYRSQSLMAKTIVVMPPTSIMRRMTDRIFVWRKNIAAQWNEAVETLKTDNIFLPNYDPAGAILVHVESGLKVLPVHDFQPEYLQDIVLKVSRSQEVDPPKLEANYKKQNMRKHLLSSAKRIFVISSVSDPILNIIIATVFVGSIFHLFSIPSRSNEPNLLEGDYLFATNYSYGYSRYSFGLFSLLPFSPGSRIFGRSPAQGEFAVYKLPKDNSTDYIKRVIGLPGDRIQMVDGVLNINGKPVKRERISDYETIDGYGQTVKVPQYLETLPNGVSHRVVERDGDNGFWDKTRVYTVPPDHFFMMGDNRDNSTDSRDLNNHGYVPYENFVSKARFVYFSLEASVGPRNELLIPRSVRFSRIGQPL